MSDKCMPSCPRALRRQAAHKPLRFRDYVWDKSMKLRYLILVSAIGTALLLSQPVPATAQGHTGTIRLIVGTVAGGAIDPYARMMAEHMSKTLGQPIIVENKPGASGNIAAQYIIDQPADGSILWLGTQAFT